MIHILSLRFPFHTFYLEPIILSSRKIKTSSVFQAFPRIRLDIFQISPWSCFQKSEAVGSIVHPSWDDNNQYYLVTIREGYKAHLFVICLINSFHAISAFFFSSKWLAKKDVVLQLMVLIITNKALKNNFKMYQLGSGYKWLHLQRAAHAWWQIT